MEDQIILIDKPAGISSFGVVARVRAHLRNEFGHKIKVGHTGTLDPFATGLLILLSSKATKRSSEFLKLDKVYEATLRLGYTSSTGDPEGEIKKTSEIVPCLSETESVIGTFVGHIIQVPPRFSAIKIGGQRAYKLARQGKDFEIPSREVEINTIDILGYSYPDLRVRVHCSSGTYIRTLAEDIGERLGTGAYLTALRRTRVGEYDVSDAHSLSDYSV